MIRTICWFAFWVITLGACAVRLKYKDGHELYLPGWTVWFAELRRDARRYRWLRIDDNWEDDGDKWAELGELSHSEFDAFVDTQMRGSSNG